jgi:hypothetical protein
VCKSIWLAIGYVSLYNSLSLFIGVKEHIVSVQDLDLPHHRKGHNVRELLLKEEGSTFIIEARSE